MSGSLFTPEEIAQYNRDGYVIVRGLFDAEEIDLLRRSAKEDREMDKHAFARDDGQGGNIRLSLWNHPGNGIYGMVARCEKLVNRVEELVGNEVYHYHSKMIMKEPKVGGAWRWHQDYGYWYQNGVLKPDLCSAFIAVDPATKENGCMQLLKGSQQMGRVNHILTGEQAGADEERVEEAKKVMELVYAEMRPGDCLMFHSNTLHCSARNDSDNPRWAMICCYNARSNNPYKESHHPRYTPLEKVPDAKIKEVGVKRFDDSEEGEAGWLDVQSDASATSLKEEEV